MSFDKKSLTIKSSKQSLSLIWNLDMFCLKTYLRVCLSVWILVAGTSTSLVSRSYLTYTIHVNQIKILQNYRKHFYI